MDRFVFPPWVNKFSTMLLVGAPLGVALAGATVFYGTLPEVMYTGYQPTQPVPFSHKIHAGELKMDCRYCHNTVEKAAHAAVPATSTCANCHNASKKPDGTLAKTVVHSASPKLTLVRDSIATGKSIEWERIHDLADYVYFNHSAHVNRGIGCVSCHGRIDRMEVVAQDQPLSMSWCLDCHRNPEAHLRPLDQITNMAWVPEDSQLKVGKRVSKDLNIHPNTNCSTCHR